MKEWSFEVRLADGGCAKPWQTTHSSCAPFHGALMVQGGWERVGGKGDGRGGTRAGKRDDGAEGEKAYRYPVELLLYNFLWLS